MINSSPKGWISTIIPDILLLSNKSSYEKNEQGNRNVLLSGLCLQLVRLCPAGTAGAGIAQRRSGLAASGGGLWATVGGIHRHRLDARRRRRARIAGPHDALAHRLGLAGGGGFQSGGSLLATILWHGGYNAAVADSEGAVAAALTAAVILAFILIVRRYGPETLSPRPKQVLED
jgi:hypothetical protein